MNANQMVLVMKKIKALLDSGAITLQGSKRIFDDATAAAERMNAAQFREYVNQIGNNSQSPAMPEKWNKATYRAYVQGKRDAAFNAYHEANRKRGKVQSIVMFT